MSETVDPEPSERTSPLVTTRLDGQILIVTVQHESLAHPYAERIAVECLRYADPELGGYTRQALSLGLVREITCASLRALVHVSDSLIAAGGRLIVFGAPKEVRAVVRRTGLTGRLVLAEGAREAVRLAIGDGPGRFRLGPIFRRPDAA